MRKRVLEILLAMALTAVFVLKMSGSAQASGQMWTVTYHTNGGDPISSEQIEDGEEWAYKRPTREGYSFKGWYKEPTLKTYWSGGKITSDLHLYARWAEILTTVNVTAPLPVLGQTPKMSKDDLVSGDERYYYFRSGASYTEIAANGESTTMTETDTFKKGVRYRVLVWITPQNGYDIDVNNTKVTINGRPADYWTAIGDGYHTCGFYIYYVIPDSSKSGTLTYYVNGGTGNVPSPVTTTFGAQVTIPNVIPEKEGYQFDGWSMNRRSNYGQYQPGDKIQLTMVSQALYAIYKPGPPRITKQPENGAGTIGQEVTFSVEASGYGELEYQWMIKAPNGYWGAAPLGTDKDFPVQVKETMDGYSYCCIVLDTLGNAVSSSTVTLKVLPKITKQPGNVTVKAGAKAEFTVAATGVKPLAYQWQTKAPKATTWKDSTNPSAKTATFSLTAQAGHNGYKVRCIVTAANGEPVTSLEGNLTVESSSSGPKITKQPADVTVKVGETASFTVAATGTGTLTYQWQTKAPSATTWRDSTNATAKKATFKITAQAAHNGYKVRCIVTDGNGKSTPSADATLTVKNNAGPKITTQPKSVTVSVGETASFTVAATGVGTLTYQWQTLAPGASTWKNSTNATAKKATFKITAQAGHNGYKVRCIVTDANGNDTPSNPATLTVQ